MAAACNGQTGGLGSKKTSRAARKSAATSATANDRKQEYIHVWERFALGLGCDRESATYLRALVFLPWDPSEGAPSNTKGDLDVQ